MTSIGDDVNDVELLSNVGCAACPCDAHPTITRIENIRMMSLKGGKGAVREFIDFILGVNNNG